MRMNQFSNPWVELKESLRDQALASGFDVAGFAAPRPPPRGEYLADWLARGWHGGMSWMERRPESRIDPASLMAGTGVILVLGVNQRPPSRPEALATYACHADYHDLLTRGVQDIGVWLTEKVGHPVAMRVCVDSAPLMEKPLAVAAGLGWQGKNALLATRGFGCWLMLAELLIDLPLPPDAPDGGHCGDCDACLGACPTDALREPYRLDASRCLAYWSVESKGAIPHAMREAMGIRVFGCDACLAACPWNRFAPVVRRAEFLPRPELSGAAWGTWATLDETGFARLFGDTPVRRLGRIRFLRNVAVALGHADPPERLDLLAGLLAHASPLVRGHAAWSLGRIARLATQACDLLRARESVEGDDTVLAEIRQARTFTPPV